MTRVLVVDNDDSFVHILVDYLAQAGANVVVRRSKEIDDADAATRGFDAVLVSPGPGRPADAEASAHIVRSAAQRALPVLGVCLGLQVIAEVFGARVGEAPELMHGMTSRVEHGGGVLYDGPTPVATPFTVGRYHSLAVEAASVKPPLRIDAVTTAGTVMGLAHESLPIVGVQFHPESVLTEHGFAIVRNWLASVASAREPAHSPEQA